MSGVYWRLAGIVGTRARRDMGALGLLGHVGGHLGSVRGVLWAHRDCRYSGDGSIVAFGAPRGCKGPLGGIRGCQGCNGGWQGLST